MHHDVHAYSSALSPPKFGAESKFRDTNSTSGKQFQSICTYVIVFNRYYDARAEKLSMSVFKNNTTSVYTRDKVVCFKL